MAIIHLGLIAESLNVEYSLELHHDYKKEKKSGPIKCLWCQRKIQLHNMKINKNINTKKI